MSSKRESQQDYFCIMVKRNYEDVWRVVGKYDTREEAEQALQEKRAYTGVFNYDNADLQVISRAEGKKRFGANWEYHPIGEKPAVSHSVSKAKKSTRAAKTKVASEE
ncbi:MAG: hypothetical protein U0528_17280 [Anaerolineae bacterium]|nr:hypothetical protein [Anaerolineae bacterium]